MTKGVMKHELMHMEHISVPVKETNTQQQGENPQQQRKKRTVLNFVLLTVKTEIDESDDESNVDSSTNCTSMPFSMSEQQQQQQQDEGKSHPGFPMGNSYPPTKPNPQSDLFSNPFTSTNNHTSDNSRTVPNTVTVPVALPLPTATVSSASEDGKKETSYATGMSVDDNNVKKHSDDDDDDDDNNSNGANSHNKLLENQEKERFNSFCEDKWRKRYNELLKFIKENGNALVPHTYPKNPQLARWVKRQRRQYKLLEDGKPSTMTQERIDELNSIGFVWDSHEITWREKFEALKDYRKKYGHCNVPSNYCDKKLGVWVKCQRRQYKFYKDGIPASMYPERVRELEKIGFQWKAR